MSVESNSFEQFQERTESEDGWRDQMLTHQEYKDHPYAESEQGIPYTFEVSNDENTIYYFGSPHVNDPENEVFNKIEDRFNETDPDMVFVEGWKAINENKDRVKNGMKEKTKEEMKREGESHFTLKLAADAGVDFESPEPDFSDEINYLLRQGYSKREVFNWYVYRQVSEYQRKYDERSQDDCEEYLTPYIDEFKEKSGWSDVKIDRLKRGVFADLDVNDTQKYSDQVDPIPWEDKDQSELNKVSRSSNNFRDRYILERIKANLENHDRLFIVYGSAHAVKQEPALKALLEK